MGGARIDAKIRARVRRRAMNHCEYCGYPQHAGPTVFECDHILPTSRGGATDLTNLAWSCPNCNALKRDKIAALDPSSKLVVPLFNPRTNRWSDHFRWTSDGLQIRGRTPIGRATVRLLRMNRR